MLYETEPSESHFIKHLQHLFFCCLQSATIDEDMSSYKEGISLSFTWNLKLVIASALRACSNSFVVACRLRQVMNTWIHRRTFSMVKKEGYPPPTQQKGRKSMGDIKCQALISDFWRCQTFLTMVCQCFFFLFTYFCIRHPLPEKLWSFFFHLFFVKVSPLINQGQKPRICFP